MELSKNERRIVNLSIFCVVICIAIFCATYKPEAPEPPESVNRPVLTQDQKDGLQSLIKLGAVEMQPENNAAYITPVAWSLLDHTAKEGFARTASIYCESKRHNNLFYCTVFDKQSGKKLAKYSSVYGFDVY